MKPVPGSHQPETGAELDLLLLPRGRRRGFELKCSDAPTLTKSMYIALQDLRLERLWVLYPGKEGYSFHERVEALPLRLLERASLEVLGGGP